MSDKVEKSHADRNKEIDYYINKEGLMVFTEAYHLRRGYCCRNGCRHCPYGLKKTGKTF